MQLVLLLAGAKHYSLHYRDEGKLIKRWVECARQMLTDINSPQAHWTAQCSVGYPGLLLQLPILSWHSLIHICSKLPSVYAKPVKAEWIWSARFSWNWPQCDFRIMYIFLSDFNCSECLDCWGNCGSRQHFSWWFFWFWWFPPFFLPFYFVMFSLACET